MIARRRLIVTIYIHFWLVFCAALGAPEGPIQLPIQWVQQLFSG